MLPRNQSRAAVVSNGRLRIKPSPQGSGELCLQRGNVYVSPHPANGIEPFFVPLLECRVISFNQCFARQRYPEIWWIRNYTIAKEAVRCDAGHRERVHLQIDCGAHDVWICREVRLPRAITDNQSRRGRGSVIALVERTARVCADAQCFEVISRDVLTAHLFGRRSTNTNREAFAAGLDRGQLLEFWRRLFEMKIEIVREEIEFTVIFLEPVVVTAEVPVSDAIEMRRIGHRQCAQ